MNLLPITDFAVQFSLSDAKELVEILEKVPVNPLFHSQVLDMFLETLRDGLKGPVPF